MHGRPAVLALADVSGYLSLACERDQARHERVVAVAVHRRRQAHDGRMDAARFERVRRRFRRTRIGRRHRHVRIVLGRRAARCDQREPRRDDERPRRPSSTAPIVSIARRSSSQFSAKREKS
jgi:hypothetical protein